MTAAWKLKDACCLEEKLDNLDSVLKSNLVLTCVGSACLWAVCASTYSVSPDQLFWIPWTAARQTALSMEILQARILEWVAMPSSRGSSQPRDWTQVSCITGRFFASLSKQGSPWILAQVTYPFSRGSSPAKNWTGVSWIEADSFPAELLGKPCRQHTVNFLHRVGFQFLQNSSKDMTQNSIHSLWGGTKSAWCI